MMLRYLSIVIIITLSASCVSTKKKEPPLFREIKVESLKSPLSSILIAGIGTAPSRIFLTQLTDKLIRNFNSSGVKSTYEYLGADIKAAKENIKRISTSGYSAILLFSPSDSALFEINNGYLNNTFDTPLPGSMNSPTVLSSMMFYQNFRTLLYLMENKRTSVWNGSISIGYDLRNEYLPATIGNIIYKCFKLNKYIAGK